MARPLLDALASILFRAVFRPLFIFGVALASALLPDLRAQSPAQSHADVLAASGDLAELANRRRAFAEMQQIENARRAAAWARADAMGWPKRILLPNGAVRELAALDGARPVYFTTHNANAAISTGANLLQAPPFSLTGSGFTVGEWDAGSARTTHQELTGRVTAVDGAGAHDHATHVGGTIAASGVQAAAKGMAPTVRIDSYDWNSDTSEMTSRGAAYPGEAGTIYLSNHSYGFISGWSITGQASPQWDWWGSGTTSTGVEDNFGQYNTYARDSDALAASLPYYLIVRSAGNDRGDDPATGAPVSLTPQGTTVVSYNPASHPPGDSVYRDGYDTMGFDSVAKNVLSVGAVADAVSGGVRAPANGAMTHFSAWGPTDDGRIKPDVVANGDGLYSSLAGSNAAYGTYSGTSMATPNTTGSAVLLINFFDQLFPGQAMRASTLKALLIHTADDLGTAGPDYQNGWGLVNAKAAADLIQTYRHQPGTRAVFEDRVTTSRTSVVQGFTWNGIDPIRVTLCWNDPAGTATTSHDSRTARLVNDLDVQVVGPDSAVHQPFVMPFVGTWTAENFGAAATTGANHTDNVEQVFVATPAVAGVYQAQVSFSGTLTNGVQPFSLIISGGAETDTAVAPSLTAISPAAASGGVVTLTLTNANVLLGATVMLTRAGQADVPASGIEVLGDMTRARVSTDGMAAGAWNVVVTNPDGQSATLANAFTIVGALWADQLETGASGWTHAADVGSDGWTLTTTDSHSPTHSFFAPAPAARTDDRLDSPAIAIPAGATGLQLAFWHRYDFETNRDGGVLELSVDGGEFFDVTSSGSGAAFASGGYNSTISSSGPPSGRSPLAGQSAWSGSSNGWTQVVIGLTDLVKYAGHALQIRWRLGTNNSTASAGWYVDDVTISGTSPANLAPSIVTPAAALPALVTGTSAALSVTATDDAGEAALIYTWVVNDDLGVPLSFSENGTTAAKNTTVTFAKAGTFTFTVTVRDVEGLTATSNVEVPVEQTMSAVGIAPVSVTLGAGDAQQFTATADDQFGDVITAAAFAWSASGGGVVDASGLFTAGAVPGGPFTVTASSGGFSAEASVSVTGQTYESWESANFTPEEIAAGLAAFDADPDDDGLVNLLEYALGTDAHALTPPLAASILLDGESQLRLTLTFTRPRELPGGTYAVEVSGDLQTWDAVPDLEIVSDATTDTVTARDPVAASAATQRFMRLRVTLAP